MGNEICLGTEIKLNVHIKPIDGVTMDDYSFVANIYCSPSKMIAINKDEAIRIDESNYVCRIDTSNIGIGRLKCKIVAQISDGDFDDGIRTEISVIDTGIDIVRNV